MSEFTAYRNALIQITDNHLADLAFKLQTENQRFSTKVEQNPELQELAKKDPESAWSIKNQALQEMNEDFAHLLNTIHQGRSNLANMSDR